MLQKYIANQIRNFDPNAVRRQGINFDRDVYLVEDVDPYVKELETKLEILKETGSDTWDSAPVWADCRRRLEDGTYLYRCSYNGVDLRYTWEMRPK